MGTSNGMTDNNIRAIEQFLFHEADLIDQRSYTEWLKLYTDDCRYWVPLEEFQKDPKTTVSLIYDDRKLIETRVNRLGQPSMHAQAPHSRTLHVIGNIRIEHDSRDGKTMVRSNQLVTEYRQNNIRIFSGQVIHHLVASGDSFKISYKQINLIHSEGDNRGIPLIL